MGVSHILILALTCLVYGICIGEVVLPGAKIRLAQKGLDYAAKKAVESLNVKGEHIPDQSGKDGKVEYSVKGMVIRDFVKPATSVTVNPGKGITWTATGASISLHGDWRYKFRKHFIKISDHGSFDVSANGISFSISFILGMGANGHPTIQSTGCSSRVGSVHVKFHGGASWLYNLFKRAISKTLEKKLTDVMCKAATKSINVDAQKKLAEVILITHVGKDNEMTLDYSLTQAPAFKPGYMDVMLKGQFAWTKAPTPPAFTPAPFPASTDASKMFYIWGSEYVINSYIDAAFQHQLVRSNLSRKNFPKGEGDFLNTTCPSLKTGCLGNFLYEVSKKFPGASVMVQMGASKSPNIRITPGKINFHAEGDMLLYADVTLVGEVFLLKLKVSVDMSVATRIEGKVLKGTVTSFVPKIEVLDSKVGKLSEKFLNAIFKMIADKFIVKQLNNLGEKGVLIPNIKDCDYVNPVLKLNDGNLMISTDLNWSPKQESTLHYEKMSPEHLAENML